MRTPILISLAAIVALPLAAVGQVYSWKDASGKTVYSDKPPLEKKAKTREVAAGVKAASAPAAQDKAAEGAAAAKAADGKAGAAAPAKSAEQQKAESDARQGLCDNARKRLIQLESTTGVLITTDEKGQQVPLVGDARKAETEAARKDVEQWCK